VKETPTELRIGSILKKSGSNAETAQFQKGSGCFPPAAFCLSSSVYRYIGRMKNLYIGTSGWMYKDWGKKFYPKDMKEGFLTFLSEEFNTVEINTSFYHLPKPTTFAKWRGETGKDFRFAVKISRFITHEKRLKQCREPIRRFLLSAKELKNKLSVVLIQLPPSLKYDKKVLSKFLSDLTLVCKKINVRPRFVLEPRHKSFMVEAPEVKSILQKSKVALVFPHSAKIPSFSPEDENVIVPFVYIRFHGPSEFAASRYGRSRLLPWAERIKKWLSEKLTVYVYFNNDVHGHAIDDARTLKELTSSL
jgi:uncharacterized protein YecE (DUF72 family)